MKLLLNQAALFISAQTAPVFNERIFETGSGARTMPIGAIDEIHHIVDTR